MGNCCSCIKWRNNADRKAIAIAVLGVDGAGKTTLTKALIGDSLEVTPTIGFDPEEIHIKNFDISLYDLGGGKKIRDIWKQYLHDVYGVIYIVDSSPPGVDRLQEVKHNLEDLLSDTLIAGKPLLLFANKSDVKDALETIDICEQLNIENIVNRNKCPCRIEACSAIKGTGKKIDKTIKEGLNWIIGMVEHNWDLYKERIDKDKEEYRKKEEVEKAAKRERVRKIREERERKEEEERKRLGIEKPEEDDEDDFVDGDPFKKLSIAELEKKEKRLKEQKKKKKDLEEAYKLKKINSDKDDNESDDGLGSRSLGPLGRPRFNIFDNEFGTKSRLKNLDQDDDTDSDIVITSKARRSTPRLPPLQQPIGTKFMDETTGTKKKKSKKGKKLKALTEVEDELPGYDRSLDNYSKSVGSLSRIDVGRVNSAMSNGHVEHSDEDDTNNDDDNKLYSPNRYLRSDARKTSKNRSDYTTYDNPSYKESRISYFDDQDSEESLDDGDEDPAKYSPKKDYSKRGRKSLDFFSSTVTKDDDEDEVDSLRVSPRRRLPALDGGDDDYSSPKDTTKVRKLKSKKKTFLKKNKTAPSPSDDDDGSISDRHDLSWTNHMSPIKSQYNKTGDFGGVSPLGRTSWGLAEELNYDEDSEKGYRPVQRSRPNVGYDDDDDLVY